MKNRFTQKTPKFFRVLRNVGATLAALGASLLGIEYQYEIQVPEIIDTIAQHATVAGAIVTALSQAAVYEEPDNKQIKE